MALRLQFEVPPESKATLLALASLGDDLKLALLDALEDTAIEIRSTALAKISGQGSGREYPRRNGAGIYRASAPGQPPARDTGGLARTLKHKIFRQDLKAAVYTSASLGFWLESGALKRKTRGASPNTPRRRRKDGSFIIPKRKTIGGQSNPMLPRPWLVPARDAHEQDFVDRVSKALDGLVNQFEAAA